MKQKQPTTMREAKSMVKERWLDRRLEKLSQQNDELRGEVDELRHDLDEERDRSKETLVALSKSRRRPGRFKWIVLAGGAYVLGAKAGRPGTSRSVSGLARSRNATARVTPSDARPTRPAWRCRPARSSDRARGRGAAPRPTRLLAPRNGNRSAWTDDLDRRPPPKR